jgi:acetolactate synthase-1/3 small subunit
MTNETRSGASHPTGTKELKRASLRAPTKDSDGRVVGRSGQSNAPQGAEQAYTLVMLVNDRPGAVDRVINMLRRRRASMQSLVVGRSELPDVVRITVNVNDSEVEFNHLLEQLRKVIDVQHIVNLSPARAIARELALVKVNSTTETCSEIIELGHFFGAHAVDVADETITLEVTGSEEKVEILVSQLHKYGIREVARTGCVAMTRGTGDNEVKEIED